MSIGSEEAGRADLTEEDRAQLREIADDYLCSADALERDLRGWPDHPNNPFYEATAKSNRRHAALCLRLAGRAAFSAGEGSDA